MALDSKLIADYTELINKPLDHMPVKEIEDFTTILSGLQAIVNSTAINISDPELADYIKDIKEFYDSPEMYVQDPNDYKEYKNIILNRIKNKIKELEELTYEQKETIINELQSHKEDVKEKHAQMQAISPPKEGDARHVESPPNKFVQAARQVLLGWYILLTNPKIAWKKITDKFKNFFKKFNKFLPGKKKPTPTTSIPSSSAPSRPTKHIPEEKPHAKQKDLAEQAAKIVQQRIKKTREASAPKHEKLVTEQLWNKKKGIDEKPKTEKEHRSSLFSRFKKEKHKRKPEETLDQETPQKKMKKGQ